MAEKSSDAVAPGGSRDPGRVDGKLRDGARSRGGARATARDGPLAHRPATSEHPIVRMTKSFEEAIALERTSDDAHRLVVPDGWQQGRGAFGGLVLGALMDAMTTREPDASRSARAFLGELCGPALPAPSRVVTRVLRRGSNQTNVAATLEQDGAVVAHASCVLASARKVSAPRIALDPPQRLPYEDARELTIPDGPAFAKHYEYRPTGALPFTRGAEPIVTGWVKERAPLTRMTAAAILGRLDAYWPGVFSIEAAPRPLATVSFMAELLRDPSTLDPRAPLFYRGRVVAESGGYFVEMRELWSGDEPVAFNQQSFAILG